MVAQGMEVVQLKLDRARSHAEEFERRWADFVSANVYTYKIDTQPPYAVHFLWIYDPGSAETQRAVTELSLIYGDFLGNIRSSLDYLAWQLVLVTGKTPDQSKQDFHVL
jgi:hypothetical protein